MRIMRVYIDASLGLAYLNHVSSNEIGPDLSLKPLLALYMILFHTFQTQNKFLRVTEECYYLLPFFCFIKGGGPSKLPHYISSFYFTCGLIICHRGLFVLLGCQGVIRGHPFELSCKLVSEASSELSEVVLFSQNVLEIRDFEVKKRVEIT